MTAPLLRTPLYDTHLAMGARMVEFAGWEMPVQLAHIRASAYCLQPLCVSLFLHAFIVCAQQGHGPARLKAPNTKLLIRLLRTDPATPTAKELRSQPPACRSIPVLSKGTARRTKDEKRVIMCYSFRNAECQSPTSGGTRSHCRGT